MNIILWIISFLCFPILFLLIWWVQQTKLGEYFGLIVFCLFVFIALGLITHELLVGIIGRFS